MRRSHLEHYNKLPPGEQKKYVEELERQQQTTSLVVYRDPKEYVYIERPVVPDTSKDLATKFATKICDMINKSVALRMELASEWLSNWMKQRRRDEAYNGTHIGEKNTSSSLLYEGSGIFAGNEIAELLYTITNAPVELEILIYEVGQRGEKTIRINWMGKFGNCHPRVFYLQLKPDRHRDIIISCLNVATRWRFFFGQGRPHKSNPEGSILFSQFAANDQLDLLYDRSAIAETVLAIILFTGLDSKLFDNSVMLVESACQILHGRLSQSSLTVNKHVEKMKQLCIDMQNSISDINNVFFWLADIKLSYEDEKKQQKQSSAIVRPPRAESPPTSF
jgi:hypothetical protein